MPRRVEGHLAHVVDLGRVDVQVQPVRSVDERALDQRRSAALDEGGGELCVQVGVRAEVRGSERVPARPVAGRVAGEDGRDRRVADLERVAGDDACPRPAARVDRREAYDVVLDDERRLQLVEDLAQALVGVDGAVAERAERWLDEGDELLDRRRPEERRRLTDEVLPELAGSLLDLGSRPEAHQPLLESLRFEGAGERLLDDEHHSVAALAQDLADPDAVVGRTVRPPPGRRR